METHTILLVFLLAVLQAGLVAPKGGRGKYPECTRVRYEVRPRSRTCTTKYECEEKCEMKKKCRTKYEYKCTDYKRRKCENVWQNQCNGKKANGRKKREERLKRQATSKRRFFQSWTNTVYDQSDLPQSNLPFASPSKGQVFGFKDEPKSKKCWKKVRQCKWKKYKSSCGNRPKKVCDEKPSQVCKKKCRNVYYCTTCPDKKPTKPRPTSKPRPTKKPVGPKPTRPKPTFKPKPKPTAGPPSPPPPGTFVIMPPAPPHSTLDVIVDAKQTKYKNKPR